jgi:hypothetical protein
MVSAMNVSDSVFALGTQIASVPYVLAALTGLVLSLVHRRRIGPVSAAFAIAGFGLMLVLNIANLAWTRYLLPRVFERADTQGKFNAILLATNVASALLATLCLSLVIAALFTRRAVSAAPSHEFQAYDTRP